MQIEAQNAPPSTPASTPTPVSGPFSRVPRVSAVGRLILSAISRKRRALTVNELVRYCHCCHSTATKRRNDLVAAGLLVTYPSEYGVPLRLRPEPPRCQHSGGVGMIDYTGLSASLTHIVSLPA